MYTDTATPRALPTQPAIVFAVLAVIGLAALLIGINTDPDRAYRVFLYNWLMWAALSQGALTLSAGMRLTNAEWQGPIQRIADSMAAFVPVSLVLFFVIYLGRHNLFEWTHHPIPGKEFWFEPNFTFTRDVVGLVWVTLMTFLYFYITVRPTLGRARETHTTGLIGGLIQRWTAGWKGDERERAIATRRGRKQSAVVALSFALVYSLIAIDMIMSLAPEWVSTMFPAYYSWGGFLSAVGLLTLICLVVRNRPGFSGHITVARQHDLGKMVFAFSIFWMYLFWSQYFVIWYANIPEETGFFVARLGSQFIQDTWYMTGFWERVAEPYARTTLAAWILLWVAPFWVLLGQRPKKTPAILGTIVVGSLIGFWIERFILVTPSLIPPEKILEGAAASPFGTIELGIAAGFVGLFFLCFLAFGYVFPGVLPAEDQ